jgi:superfamily II DNA/RNA helicase
MINSKFFTNQDNNNLSTKLNQALRDYNIKYAEFLIGFFRISGFKEILKHIQNVEKIRILIGIDTDKYIVNAQKEANNLNLYEDKNIQTAFESEQKDILDKKAKYSYETQESINILIDMLKNNQIQLRASKEQNIHSKVYILRDEELVKFDGTTDINGIAITGSSNLSINGLKKQHEFNVALTDNEDIKFALNYFEELWKDAIQINDSHITNISNQSYLQRVTPYELYIKFLIEHFDTRLELDPELSKLLPKHYTKLTYQEDAVNDGLSKLRKHNGFILADVVGLGKTVTTAWILKKLLFEIKGQILIITPPAIKKEWKETIENFDITSYRNVDFITNGSLKKIANPQSYDVIVIDESHKFRNEKSKMYQELKDICEKGDKKVILISATPFNNAPKDVANQVYLFQNRRDSTIINYNDLETVFSALQKDYKEIESDEKNNKISPQTKKERLKSISSTINKILSQITIRRTRSDLLNIKRYKDDLKSQKIEFPTPKLEEIEYNLSDDFETIYSTTIEVLIHKLDYTRFKAIGYLIPEQKALFENEIQLGFADKSSKALAQIIRNLLIKRFESSVEAFKISINRQKENLEKFIDMYNNNKIYIGYELDLAKYENIEDIEKDIEEKSEKFQNIKTFTQADFEKGFEAKLHEDLKNFTNLCKEWEDINHDFKFDKLKELLKNNNSNKIVIFTESQDTANYLDKELNNKKILTVTGNNKDRLKQTIRENFDANYDKENGKKAQKNDYNIIITTDVLAEGINLHRADTIYNYDIPWNSTKLMQRIGRINRIGSSHKDIFVYNFKPHATSNNIIKLDEKAYRKLQTFHYTFGEDSQVYTQDEEIENDEKQSLFSNKTNKEINPELEFFEDVINLREKDNKYFDKIKKLPNKITVQRKKQDRQNETIIFIKQDTKREFIKSSFNGIESIDFVSTAKILKAKKDEKGIYPIKQTHYETVNQILNNKPTQTKEKRKLTKKEQEAIKHLKKMNKLTLIQANEYQILNRTIEDGKGTKLLDKIIKTKNNFQSIIDEYELDTKDNKETVSNTNKEIILSQSFM